MARAQSLPDLPEDPLAGVQVGEVVLLAMPGRLWKQLGDEAAKRNMRPLELMAAALDSYLTRTAK